MRGKVDFRCLGVEKAPGKNCVDPPRNPLDKQEHVPGQMGGCINLLLEQSGQLRFSGTPGCEDEHHRPRIRLEVTEQFGDHRRQLFPVRPVRADFDSVQVAVEADVYN